MSKRKKAKDIDFSKGIATASMIKGHMSIFNPKIYVSNKMPKKGEKMKKKVDKATKNAKIVIHLNELLEIFNQVAQEWALKVKALKGEDDNNGSIHLSSYAKGCMLAYMTASQHVKIKIDHLEGKYRDKIGEIK